MANLTIETEELHKYGRELGFIFAEFVAGFMAGMDDYAKALEAAQKEAEQKEDQQTGSPDEE